MKVKGYEDLTVWQRSIDLTAEIYQLVKKLPKEEMYELSSQMRRSAVSIASNIAEGQARKSTKEFTNFLSIAQGSKAELETQLIICNRLNYLTKDETETARAFLLEIGKMLAVLVQKLRDNN